jgi:hypothetical protein
MACTILDAEAGLPKTTFMSTATNIPLRELAVFAPVPVADGAEFRSRMGSISRQSFVYFAGTIFTAAAGYFFKIYLARTLGAEALGLYALGMTIVGFVGLFNSLGLPIAAARFVAAYCARGDYSQLGSFLRGSLGLLTALNVLLAGIVLLVGPWLALHFYHAPKLSPYLWTFAAIMLLGVLNMFLGQVMAGYRDVARRTFITHFTGTPVNIAIAVLLISLGFGLTGYMAAQVVSALLVLGLLGASVWKMSPAQTRNASGLYIKREVVAFSTIAYGIAALQFLLAQSDKIILGYYLDAKRVGIYAVAMALVGFVPIALDSVNQIFSPIISELHAAENHAVLQQLYAYEMGNGPDNSAGVEHDRFRAQSDVNFRAQFSVWHGGRHDRSSRAGLQLCRGFSGVSPADVGKSGAADEDPSGECCADDFPQRAACAAHRDCRGCDRNHHHHCHH